MSERFRVLHFSDVHLERGFAGVGVSEFANKRFVGYANLMLRRRGHFAGAARKVRALAELVERERVDIALCTGDYSALGTVPELEYAREVVDPIVRAVSAYVTLPGNHDIYLEETVHDRRFERLFESFMTTDLPELATADGWPLVRLFGRSLAIVSVNSARPKPALHLSTGRIPDAQLRALDPVFAHPALEGRFVLVATHYAPRLWTGRPDTPLHGLDNADAFLEACRPVARGVICHGHVHRRYFVREPGLRAGLCGAGSATYVGREGAWLLDVGEGACTATPLRFDAGGFVAEPAGVVEL